MGSVVGKQMKEIMEENLKKNQEFMLASQKMQMERQLQMQMQMQQRQMAASIAGARELFDWMGSFYCVAGLGCFIGFSRSRNPATLVPLIPLTWIVGYYGHLAYGNKTKRIREEAESILQTERDMLRLPNGQPTFEEIERCRLALKK